MGDEIIRTRMSQNLWWREHSFDEVMKWNELTVLLLDDTKCLVNVVDQQNNNFNVELHRSDYDKIIDKKAFRLKFNLKKHKIF